MRSSDAPIHVTHWGSKGPRILMIHGGAQGSQSGGERHFSIQEQLGQQGWQVIVPDRPGHGRSPRQGWPDDAERDGAWVAEMLLDGAHLVGHSFGGCVALAAAARNPAMVRSMTLIEPGMLGIAIGRTSVLMFILRYALLNVLSPGASSKVKHAIRQMRVPPGIMEQPTTQRFEALASGLSALRLPSRHILKRELAIVRDYKIPLLVISGGWSRALDDTSAAVARLGGGEHVIISSPHHFPQLISQEFNHRLAEFTKRAEAGLLPDCRLPIASGHNGTFRPTTGGCLS